jgi:hypothetical protein
MAVAIESYLASGRESLINALSSGCILASRGQPDVVMRGWRSLRDCCLALLGVMEGRRQTHSNLQVFVEVVGDNAEELIFLLQKWYMLRHDDSF